MSRARRRLLSVMGGLAVLMAAAAHAGSVTYVYTDPQGTPLAEADASGNITATYDYAPYGSQALGTPPNGPGYTGHVNDPDTGLVYMQARYYDPAVGRFISVDPVGFAVDNKFNLNRFAYGNNNPILNIDPNGKFPESPLIQLDWLNQVINRSIDENVKPAAAYAYKAVDDHVTLTLAVAAAPGGAGGQASIDALHPDKLTVGVVYGEGYNISLDVSQKHPFSMQLGGNPTPSSVLGSLTLSYGEVFHGAFTIALDKNFNLSFAPAVGLGASNMVLFKHTDLSASAFQSDIPLGSSSNEQPVTPPPVAQGPATNQ
ncbi:hypothetical protein B0E46_12925 [Rhodanobacter sp. B04]|nr:hypothetical protein B0E46_12925 [Rhodanobacter sp. B04]